MYLIIPLCWHIKISWWETIPLKEIEFKYYKCLFISVKINPHDSECRNIDTEMNPACKPLITRWEATDDNACGRLVTTNGVPLASHLWAHCCPPVITLPGRVRRRSDSGLPAINASGISPSGLCVGKRTREIFFYRIILQIPCTEEN